MKYYLAIIGLTLTFSLMVLFKIYYFNYFVNLISFKNNSKYFYS